MRLILIRHGETEHNRGRLTLGRADIALNATGRAQARALAGSFVRRPAAIFASPLSRAADTAGVIAASTGTPVAIEPALIEMDVGEMEHLTLEELRTRHPDFLGLWLSDEVADARMPSGESLQEVQERAWPAITRMAAEFPEGEVAVVTHNFVILTLLCWVLDLPLARFRRLRHDLAARTVLDMRAGAATLIQLNDRAHLQAAGLAGGPTSQETRR